MKKSKKFLALAMALCMTAVSSSCGKPDKIDIDFDALGSAVENAVESAAQSNSESAVEKEIREVPVYSGKNELIRDMCTLLKSDSPTESMKRSRMYELMCDIIEKDHYSISINASDKDEVIEVETNVSGADWLCIMRYDGGRIVVLKNSRDIYVINNDEKQYIAYSFLISLSPESRFISEEDKEKLPNLLSSFNELFQYELADSGSETLNGVEYYYEDIRKNESSETLRYYYTGDRCIGPVDSGSVLDSAGCLSSLLITKVEIPSEYTEITWDNMFG